MNITYSIESDGYNLYLNTNATPWIICRDFMAKTYVPDGTYEDNAKAHIENIKNPPIISPTNEELSEGLAELTELVISNTGGTTV